MKKAFKAYVLTVGISTFLIASVGLLKITSESLFLEGWLYFIILILFASLIELPVSSYAHVTIDTPFYIAAVFLLPWPIASLAAFVANVLSETATKKRRWEHRVLNVGVFTLCTAIVGWLASIFIKRPGEFSLILTNFLLFLVFAILFSFLNIVFLLVGTSLREQLKVAQIASSVPGSSWLAPTLGMSLVGMLFAYLVSLSGTYLLPTILVIIPIYLIYLALKRTSELEGTIKNVLISFIEALEGKDPFTAQHSQRVAVYSKKIAEKMGLSVKQIQEIEHAALLHDIGKLAVPEYILYKPARLGHFEWKFIQEHPRLGWHMLNKFQTMGSVAEYILHHHEKANGTGYPNQLLYGEISIGGRIIAVADAYDAMRSARPYRRPFTKEEALNELKEHQITKYDPEIIKALEEVIKETPQLEKRPVPVCLLYPEYPERPEGH